MPLIKRYPNRKLYDTEAKAYVTLEQLTALIQQGADVQVIDHETGEDLTNLTLSQIILEQEKKRSGFLPRNLLTDLIRTGGSTLEQVIQTVGDALHLGDARHLGESSQELEIQLENQVGKLIEQGKLSLEQAQTVLRVDNRVTDVLHRLNVPTHEDIAQLQAQLEALNAQLAALITLQTQSVKPETPNQSPEDKTK